MASAPPLRENAPLTGRGTDPRGMTLADLAKMTPFEQMMASLAITGEDAQIAETFQQQELPQMRPMQDQWGMRLGDLMREGAAIPEGDALVLPKSIKAATLFRWKR